jgi:hypothetical protein
MFGIAVAYQQRFEKISAKIPGNFFNPGQSWHNMGGGFERSKVKMKMFTYHIVRKRAKFTYHPAAYLKKNADRRRKKALNIYNGMGGRNTLQKSYTLYIENTTERDIFQSNGVLL